MATYPKCKLCGKPHPGNCNQDMVNARIAVMRGESSSDVKAVISGLRSSIAAVEHGRPVPPIPPAITKLADEVKALKAAIVERDSVIAGLRSELESMKARPSPAAPADQPSSPSADSSPAFDKARYQAEYMRRKRAEAKAAKLASS